MTSYTVERRQGCTLVFGAIPTSDLVRLMQPAVAAYDPEGQPVHTADEPVVSIQLAELAGASFAWGQPPDVQALTEQLQDEKIRAAQQAGTEDAAPAQASFSPNAQAWLAKGRRGLSSCAMFGKFTGVRPGMLRDEDGWPHPHDPDDLLRCLKLLRDVPEFAPRMPEMAACSASWAALCEAWDELVALMSVELPPAQWDKLPSGARAPKTFARMRQILDAVRAPQVRQGVCV